MSDYMIVVRNRRKGRFGNEPGPTHFLKIPAGESPSPDHKIKKKDWIDAALDESKDHQGHSDESDPREGDLLIFIHGYNNSQDTVLSRHRRLKSDLEAAGYHGGIVSFDWPSADKALNYLEDRSDAKKSALSLVDDGIRTFTELQRRGCEINVHILAHSTGAYVVREAFDDADDRPAIAETSWSVSQVAFIGADVSRQSLRAGNPKTSSLFRHSVRLTNYSNPFDSVLKLSNVKRVGVAPRAGRVGLPEQGHPQAVDVDCGSYFQTLEESTATFLGNFSHSWQIGNPVFAQDLAATLAGDVDRHHLPTRERIAENLTRLRRPPGT